MSLRVNATILVQLRSAPQYLPSMPPKIPTCSLFSRLSFSARGQPAARHSRSEAMGHANSAGRHHADSLGQTDSQSSGSSPKMTPPPDKAQCPASDCDHMPLKGRVYAIAGGCSGIAFGTAKLLSRRGGTVCLGDVDPAAMKAAEDYFSSRYVPYMINKVDVSNRREVDDWIDSIVRKYGRLYGACNAAGVIGKYHGISTVAELRDDEWDKIIGVNLTGMMYCLRAQLRNIVDGGSIVNVASIHGLKGKQESVCA